MIVHNRRKDLRFVTISSNFSRLSGLTTIGYTSMKIVIMKRKRICSTGAMIEYLHTRPVVYSV